LVIAARPAKHQANAIKLVNKQKKPDLARLFYSNITWFKSKRSTINLLISEGSDFLTMKLVPK
jgi:hypothetical protein